MMMNIILKRTYHLKTTPTHQGVTTPLPYKFTH